MSAQDLTTTVRGTVIDSLTSKPVSGALVDLDRNPPSRRGNDRESRSEDNRGREQRTDANGRFEFPDVEPKLHIFSITKKGYTSATNEGIDYSSYTVDLSRNIGDLRFFLTPAARVSGHVISNDGRPMKGVLLTLYKKYIEDGRRVWQHTREELTDENGFYGFSGLQAGSYVVVSGWLFDNDPGMRPGPGCSAYAFMPQSGYVPTANPGVADFSSAVPTVLAQGQQATADLRLQHQTFHRVRYHVGGQLSFPSNEIRDRNGRTLEIPQPPGSHCGRIISPQYDRITRLKTIYLPDGTYTLLANPGYGKDEGPGKYISTWLGNYTTFRVSGSDLTVPSVPAQSKPTPSVAIHIHVNSSRSNDDRTRNTVCQGDGKQPSLNNLWLSRVDALPEVSLPINASYNRNGSLEFWVIEPGRYWVHAGADNGYVAAITSAGVDMSREPLVVGLDSTSPALEISLRNDCSALRLNYAPSNPNRDFVAMDRVFYAMLVPQFVGFAAQEDAMFEVGRAKVAAGSVTPGHYKFYIVWRERKVEFRDLTEMPTALGPGQDVWLKPGGTTEIICRRTSGGMIPR